MKGDRPGPVLDRFLEVLAVVLLGIATVGTAWCGLQSTLWREDSDRVAGVAAAENAEANRLFALASQAVAYDASTVASYAQAVATGNEELQDFYRKTLVRKGFSGYLDAWEQQLRAGGTPVNLLEDQAYLGELLGPYRDAQAKAEGHASSAEEAGRVGDLYVLSTVLLAVALFFAGVTATFRSPTLRIALLTACLLTILLSIGRLADLPVAPATWTLFTQG